MTWPQIGDYPQQNWNPGQNWNTSTTGPLPVQEPPKRHTGVKVLIGVLIVATVALAGALIWVFIIYKKASANSVNAGQVAVCKEAELLASNLLTRWRGAAKELVFAEQDLENGAVSAFLTDNQTATDQIDQLNNDEKTWAKSSVICLDLVPKS